MRRTGSLRHCRSMPGYDNYIEKACDQQTMVGTIGRPLSLKENLMHQQAKATAELHRINELLSLLEKHPETERILELLGTRF